MTATMHLYGSHLAVPGGRRMFDKGPDWMTDPSRMCAPQRGKADLFTSESATELAEAAGLCRVCPFVNECGEWARATKQRYGVWGASIRGRVEAPAKPAKPEAPDPLGPMNPNRFGLLTHGQQVAFVKASREAGVSFSKLAQRTQRSITDLQILIGHDGPTFDEELRQMAQAGLGNKRIAKHLKVNQTTIARRRKALGLGNAPVGRPRKQLVAS